MNNKRIIPDTDQTKRMKAYAISGVYSHGGDLFKLLDTKEMHSLVVQVKKGNIDGSKLVFGKDTITLEERFLENVDRYITYIRDNFFLNSSEQFLIIEESLTNKYAEILLCKDNIHSAPNQYERIKKYSADFVRMFLYNFYTNVFLFSKLYEDNVCIKRLKKELSKYNYDNDNDIIEIQKIFEKILYLRKNNVYNCFVPMNEIKKEQYEFYAFQMEWVLKDYYSLNWNKRFSYESNDNFFIAENGSTILFNILKKENKEYKIEFAIQNPYFSAKINNFYMKIDELDKLLNRFKKCYQTRKDNKETNEEMDFIDPAISFNFWKDKRNYELVELKFHFNRSTEYYNASLEREDIKGFINLLENAINDI